MAFSPPSLMNAPHPLNPTMNANPMNMPQPMNAPHPPTMNTNPMNIPQPMNAPHPLNPTANANPMAFSPPNLMNVPQNANQPRTPEQQGTSVPLLTTPSDDTSTLEDFLRYVHVDPNSGPIIKGLNQLGITHWLMFRCYEVHELIAAVFPDGPSQALIKAAKHCGNQLRMQQSRLESQK
ncbi:hypothetical protein PtA15_12A165 [Puccinia triticina]|nr:uncharacterized protein PtA15_12A165 [Puccinia triticina]WAQ90179.1 hypothetical protein PtA15_12A165 [Puccinia triticina]